MCVCVTLCVWDIGCVGHWVCVTLGVWETVVYRTIVEGLWAEQGRLQFVLLSIAEMLGTEVPEAFRISKSALHLFNSEPPGDLDRLFKMGEGHCTDREVKRDRPAYRWTSLLESKERDFQLMRHGGCSSFGELMCRWLSIPGYPFIDQTPDYARDQHFGLVELLQDAAKQQENEVELSHLAAEPNKSTAKIGTMVMPGLSPIMVPGAGEMELRRLRNKDVRAGFRFFFWQPRTGEDLCAFFLLNVLTGRCLVFQVEPPVTALNICRALRCLLLHLRFPAAAMLTPAPSYAEFIRLRHCGQGPEAEWPMLERLLQQWSLDHQASPWQTVMRMTEGFYSLDLHTVERGQSDFYITMQIFDRLLTRTPPSPKLLEAVSLRLLRPTASSHTPKALTNLFSCFRCGLWFLQEIFAYEQAQIKSAASGALAARRKTSGATTSSRRDFDTHLGQTFITGCFIDCADLTAKRRQQIQGDERDGLAHERQPLSALMANLDVTLNLDATPAFKKEPHSKSHKNQPPKRTKVFVPPLATSTPSPLLAFAAHGSDPAIRAALPPQDLESMSIAMQANGSFLVCTSAPRSGVIRLPAVASSLFRSSAEKEACLLTRSVAPELQRTTLANGQAAFYMSTDAMPPLHKWPPTDDEYFPGTTGVSKRPLFQPLFTLVPRAYY